MDKLSWVNVRQILNMVGNLQLSVLWWMIYIKGQGQAPQLRVCVARLHSQKANSGAATSFRKVG